MQTASSSPKRSRKRIWFLLLLLLAGGGYWLHSSAGGSALPETGTPVEMDRHFTAERGDFNITILLEGGLDAIKRYDLRCMVKGERSKIQKLVKDRSEVKKGEMVFELDPETHRKRLEDLQLSLDEARKELAVAQEDLKMTRASNLSAIKGSADALRAAREALQKYTDLEFDQERKTLRNALDTAREKLRTMEEELRTAKEALAEAESTDELKLAGLEDAVTKAGDKLAKAEKELDTADHKQRVFRQYDHPRKHRDFKEKMSQAELNLAKTIVEAKGRVIQSEQKIRLSRKKVERTELEIKATREDLKNMVVTAPVDGIVEFGDSRRSRWREPKTMEIGTTLSYRELVASIPDLSGFQIKVEVPEEYRSRISLKQLAKIKCSALPNVSMEGEVMEIAAMARHVNHWDKGSPKIYPTKISVKDPAEKLMPGMTVQVEVIVETVSGVLFLPVEAVYNREGTAYIKVRNGTDYQEMAVRTGRSSASFVEIKEGLKEGQDVLLFRQSGGEK